MLRLVQSPTPASGQRVKENARRDKALNRERIEAGKARELEAQIRQLIEVHRVPIEDGEVNYNFVDGGKIKRLYMSESLHSRIARGSVGIVKSGDGYELVAAEAAAKIEARAKDRVLVLNKVAEKSTEEEDSYADFKVPDDLIW